MSNKMPVSVRRRLEFEKTEPGLLTPKQAIILAQFDPGKARDEMKPGTIETSFQADVIGKVTIGEDFEQQVSIPWKQIALALLEGQSQRAMLRVGKQAIESPGDIDIEGKLKETLSPILGKRPCKGRVTGTCIVRIHQEGA